MKWAAVSLVALSALCVPGSLQAQELTAASVATALNGFGDAFRRSNCFIGWKEFRPLQIAVAQMDGSRKFTSYEEDTISEWVEEALAADPFFVVASQRRHWELAEIRQALGELKAQAAKDPLDGIITIRETGGRITVVAYANDSLSVCQSRSIAIGKIVQAPDVPEKFFEHAARKLPDKDIEQVVVMAPVVSGVGGIPGRVLGQQLREQLADAIKEVFQTRASRSAGNNSARPDVRLYADGMDVLRAWQARVQANRTSQGGIEVRVEFRGPPDSQSGTLFDRGYLAPDIVPTESGPEVLAFAEATCRGVSQALATQTDPDALQAMGREGLCPGLSKELAEKEKFYRERICGEDRAHWREAMTGPVDAMETTAGALRCPQVAEDARKELRQRKDREAAVADMKSTAVNLGVLPDGGMVERKAAIGGAVATGVWRFEINDADTLEARFDDLNANVTVDLLDSSWKAVRINPVQSAPKRKEISTVGKLNPGAYYIRVAAAAGQQSSFTLHVAKGWIDTVGDTIETAHDLGSLGLGTQTIRKRIGGADKGDVYKFTAQEQMRLQLAASDMTSDIQLDLLNQSGQVIQSRRGRDRQNVESTLEPRSIYYISVKPSGEITPYSLGIGLSKIGPAPFSKPDIAAEAAISAAPSSVTHSVTASAPEYFRRFPLTAPALVSIDLTWEDQQTELELDLFKEESDRRLLQKRSVEPHAVSQKISNQPLEPGTYLIRVKRNAGSSPETPFTLSMRGATLNPIGPAPNPGSAAPNPGGATPKPGGATSNPGIPTPKPGATASKPSKEAATTILIGPGLFTYTLPANENDFSGVVSVTDRSKIATVLNWDDRAVDLDMELKDEGGKVIASSHGTIPTEKFEPVLEPGTYTLHVYRARPTSMAAVPLRITVNRAGLPARSTSSQAR
jgi:hypothetical protein